MAKKPQPDFSRRGLLKALAALPFVAMAARLRARPLYEPTPEIPDDDGQDPTPSQTEGPYFTPKSPERGSLKEIGIEGAGLILTGRVIDTHGKPVPGALLDFWHCDAAGVYDNSGYRLRGHQFTDTEGRYRLETIFPGQYPGRTRHIHVKVQPKGGRVLTTQLYFPDEPRNARDGIFDRRLLVKMEAKGAEKSGSFDFVLAL